MAEKEEATIEGSDDEWEEQQIVVELHGIMDPDFFTTCKGEYKILGLETGTPMLQVDNVIFKGQYEEPMGTDLLFSVPKNGTEDEVTLVGTSTKHIRFERVFLVPKSTDLESLGEGPLNGEQKDKKSEV
eukprot:comp5207_c0_seq1/m.1250 comp5207_c0_seq1/g.1250  ORF comp5207_c0_seq1/g.1250 comp5207_c0_seq1/m.1250 type:complete len:129 (-) comp5207_c0_seq1:56-442(-)